MFKKGDPISFYFDPVTTVSISYVTEDCETLSKDVVSNITCVIKVTADTEDQDSFAGIYATKDDVEPLLVFDTSTDAVTYLLDNTKEVIKILQKRKDNYV